MHITDPTAHHPHDILIQAQVHAPHFLPAPAPIRIHILYQASSHSIDPEELVGGGPRVRENEDGQIRSGKRAFIKAFAKRFRETETHSRNRFDRHRFNLFPSSHAWARTPLSCSWLGDASSCLHYLPPSESSVAPPYVVGWEG